MGRDGWWGVGVEGSEDGRWSLGLSIAAVSHVEWGGGRVSSGSGGRPEAGLEEAGWRSSGSCRDGGTADEMMLQFCPSTDCGDEPVAAMPDHLWGRASPPPSRQLSGHSPLASVEGLGDAPHVMPTQCSQQPSYPTEALPLWQPVLHVHCPFHTCWSLLGGHFQPRIADSVQFSMFMASGGCTYKS